jgi:hypothetical protein
MFLWRMTMWKYSIFALALLPLLQARSAKAEGCVEIRRYSGDLVRFYNTCNKTIIVSWRDDGDCNTGSGCSTGLIGPGKFSGNTARGQIRYKVEFP